MTEETRLWLINVLTSWLTTWEAEPGAYPEDLDKVIDKLRALPDQLSISEFNLILFHLWQRYDEN